MKPFFFDLETETFRPGYMLPLPICMSFAEPGQPTRLVEADRIPEILGPVFERALSGEYVLTGYDVAYDFGCLLAHVPRLWSLIWQVFAADKVTCCRLRERLLDIAEGTLRREFDSKEDEWSDKKYGLDDVLLRRLQRRVDKNDLWRMRYGDLKGIRAEDYPEGARHYAIEDSEHGPDLFLSQEERARQLRYEMPTQYDEARASLILRLMSAQGLFVDHEQVVRMLDSTKGQLDRYQDILLNWKLVRVEDPGGQYDFTTGKLTPRTVVKNMNAIKALVKSTFVGKEIPKTETGQIQTGKDVLEQCDHPGLAAKVEHDKIVKLRSTYLSRLLEADDLPIHPSYDAIGAESDRTAAWDPPIQQQPRVFGVRECFIPPPGKVFLACDFDSQEMRTWAQTCLDLTGRSKLARLYQADPDFDPHLQFAAEQFLHVPYTDAMRAKNAKDTATKEARQRAKAANFGFPGGLGAATFLSYARGYGIKINFDEAEAIRNGWFRQWPEARNFFAHVSNLIGSAGYGKQIIPRSGFVRNGVGYSNGANGYFQTPAAHAFKKALWEVGVRCYAVKSSALYGSRPAWPIHDEIGLTTDPDPDSLTATAEEMSNIMCAAMAIYTPDVPPRASATAMTRWSKGAEPVRDEHGRLIPCQITLT